MNGCDLYVGTEWGDSGDDEEPAEYQARIPGGVFTTVLGHPSGSIAPAYDPDFDMASINGGQPSPEEATRVEFLARAPAMGISAGETAKLREFDKREGASNRRVLPRDLRKVFRMLRSRQGTGGCCSPRHKMPFDSRDEGSPIAMRWMKRASNMRPALCRRLHATHREPPFIGYVGSYDVASNVRQALGSGCCGSAWRATAPAPSPRWPTRWTRSGPQASPR
jgi:hypothetical protein